MGLLKEDSTEHVRYNAKYLGHLNKKGEWNLKENMKYFQIKQWNQIETQSIFIDGKAQYL